MLTEWWSGRRRGKEVVHRAKDRSSPPNTPKFRTLAHGRGARALRQRLRVLLPFLLLLQRKDAATQRRCWGSLRTLTSFPSLASGLGETGEQRRCSWRQACCAGSHPAGALLHLQIGVWRGGHAGTEGGREPLLLLYGQSKNNWKWVALFWIFP